MELSPGEDVKIGTAHLEGRRQHAAVFVSGSIFEFGEVLAHLIVEFGRAKIMLEFDLTPTQRSEKRIRAEQVLVIEDDVVNAE